MSDNIAHFLQGTKKGSVMSGYNNHPSIHIENSDGKVFGGDDEILRCLRAELSGDR